MSIVSDMKSIMLQRRKKVPTNSGAPKYEWEDYKTVDVAIYNESTHTGITFYKGLDKHTSRFIDGDTIYTITKINERGRLTSLLLKVVETNV